MHVIHHTPPLTTEESLRILAPWLEHDLLSRAYDPQGSRWLDRQLIEREAQQGRREVR